MSFQFVIQAMTEDPPVDMLEHIFEKHKELQLAIPPKGEWPGDESFTKEQRIEALKTWKLAIESELQEMLDETGWKPWATSRHINEEAAKVEVIDQFFFWLNIAMTMRMSAVDVFEGYGEKWAKNMVRHKDGTYDGVTGKCPGCKRGLDDAGARCTVVDELADGATIHWCQDKGYIYPEGAVTVPPRDKAVD